MEQQSLEEIRPKLSRSAARHLRRKKFRAAQRETDKNILASDIVCDKKQISSIKIEKSVEKTNSSDLKIIGEGSSSNVICEKSASLHKKTSVSDLLNSDLKSNVYNCADKAKTVEEICKLPLTSVANDLNTLTSKMDSQEEKSREKIKAEREAKKLAKAAAKAKAKQKDNDDKSKLPKKSNNEDDVKSQEKPLASKSSIETQNNSNITIKSTKQVATPKEAPAEKKVESQKSQEDSKPEMSKAELRAERRAKQEAQRAAKQALQAEKKNPAKSPVPDKTIEKSATPVKKEAAVKKIVTKTDIKDNLHEVNLFKHLYVNRNNISQLINSSNIKIHPAIIRLGVQYAEKVIIGSNARCVALLAAVKQLIDDFERPQQADFARGLETSLLQAKNYLDFCRPSSVSMENALKHLQRQMSILPSTIADKEAKLKLTNAIDTYILEQIDLADKAISQAIQKKIVNGDVILTYGFSSLIHKILCDAYNAKKQFRVIVVDGRPWLEGKELLRRLVKHGIDCSYMLVNALSFIMPQVNKVFLGAHAILANGAVMSRVGTAQVALMANAFNVPVLVACETHKSSERVQTDSIVFNEIGDPDQLVKNTNSNSKKSCLANWKSKKTLNLLNITYDVTPADLVTAVVTELAILPCTSVPVILRIKPSKIEKN